MLLCRFPIAVKPELSATKAQTVTVMVSYYRRSVDPAYQRTISQKIEAGTYDRYVAMMLHLLLDTGKFSHFIFRHFWPKFPSLAHLSEYIFRWRKCRLSTGCPVRDSLLWCSDKISRRMEHRLGNPGTPANRSIDYLRKNAIFGHLFSIRIGSELFCRRLYYTKILFRLY